MIRAAVCLSAAFILFMALQGATHAPAPSPRPPSPSPVGSRGPVPPPPPSESDSSPFGIIGALERSRTMPKRPADWLATTLTALEKYLGDRDPAVVARALLALGRIGDPAADPVLVRILTDSHRPEKVRAMARSE